MKIIGMVLMYFGLLDGVVKLVLIWLVWLVMVDVFLLVIYVVIVKGIGLGCVELVWGFYLFIGCVIVLVVIFMFFKVD